MATRCARCRRPRRRAGRGLRLDRAPSLPARLAARVWRRPRRAPGPDRHRRRPLGPRHGRRPAGVPGAPARPPLSLARHRLPLPRGPAAAPGGAARRGALDALTGGRAARRSWSPARSRSPRRSPTPSCGPTASRCSRGESVDLADVAELLAEAGYERTEQVEERGQFAIRGDILDAYPATEERAIRVELFGDEIESMRWFSTFTQRSLGDAERVELAPAAELGAEHRELADLIPDAETEERPDLAELIPVDRFRAPLDLVPDDTFVAIAAARGDPRGAQGPLGGRDRGDARRRRPAPLRRRRR